MMTDLNISVDDEKKEMSSIAINKALHSDLNKIRLKVAWKTGKEISWSDFISLMWECGEEKLNGRIENEETKR